MTPPNVTFSLAVDDPRFSAVLAILMGTTAMSAPSVTTTASQTAAPVPTPMPHAPLAMPPVPQGDDDDGDDGAIPGAPPVDTTGLVDSAGLPWDERIHAETRATNGDGTWRKRRKVDPTVVAAVELELRGNSPAGVSPPPPPVTMPPIPMTPAIPAPPQGAVTMPPAVTAPVAMPVAAPVPQALPPIATALPQPSDTMDMPTFMQGLTQQLQKSDVDGSITGTPGRKVIDADYMIGICGEVSTAFIAANYIQQPLRALTDIGGLPDNAHQTAFLNYTIQLFQRDNRWS